MKKMQKAIWILAVLLAAGCANSTGGGGGGNDNNNNNTGGVDYTNYTTGSSYVFRVRNMTGKNLVAFKGGVAADKLIGGIPAHASQHGLPKNPALFNTQSEDFPLVLITQEQYNANKNYLQALENTPFTRIFAFYNSRGTNETVYEIAGELGGNKTIYIDNGTSLNVELRMNGIQGETLGYAAAGMHNTTLKVNSDDYYVFPVFKKYNAVRDEIITVYPKYSASGLAKRFYFQLGEGTNEYTINITSAYLEGTVFSSGAAWLTINNQSDSGIRLMKGGVVQRTPEGISVINNGYSRTYQIDMAKVGTDGNPQYGTSIQIGAYTVGAPGIETYTLGTPTLQADHRYQITLTGSPYSSLAVGELIDQGAITFNDF